MGPPPCPWKWGTTRSLQGALLCRRRCLSLNFHGDPICCRLLGRKWDARRVQRTELGAKRRRALPWSVRTRGTAEIDQPCLNPPNRLFHGGLTTSQRPCRPRNAARHTSHTHATASTNRPHTSCTDAHHTHTPAVGCVFIRGAAGKGLMSSTLYKKIGEVWCDPVQAPVSGHAFPRVSHPPSHPRQSCE